MAYDLTCLNDADSMVPIFQCASQYTNYLFGVMLVGLIWAIVYYRVRGGFRGEPTREAVAAATFLSIIIAVLFRILGIITNEILAGLVVLVIGAAVMLLNVD